MGSSNGSIRESRDLSRIPYFSGTNWGSLSSLRRSLTSQKVFTGKTLLRGDKAVLHSLIGVLRVWPEWATEGRWANS